MTRKFWNWVRNEEPDSFGSDRTLYLDGEISDETWFGDEVTPQLFKDELKQRRRKHHPLDQQSGR
jgi:ATP-dependent Clp protease protease subunit